MVKRVLPLLIALAVAAAPIALEACQIVCGSAAAPPAHDHACHEAAAPHTGVSAESHACSHHGDLPGVSAIGAARTVDYGVVLAGVGVPGASAPPPHARDHAEVVRSSASPDRGDVRLAVPLRI